MHKSLLWHCVSDYMKETHKCTHLMPTSCPTVIVVIPVKQKHLRMPLSCCLGSKVSGSLSGSLRDLSLVWWRPGSSVGAAIPRRILVTLLLQQQDKQRFTVLRLSNLFQVLTCQPIRMRKGTKKSSRWRWAARTRSVPSELLRENTGLWQPVEDCSVLPPPSNHTHTRTWNPWTLPH